MTFKVKSKEVEELLEWLISKPAAPTQDNERIMDEVKKENLRDDGVCPRCGGYH